MSNHTTLHAMIYDFQDKPIYLTGNFLKDSNKIELDTVENDHGLCIDLTDDQESEAIEALREAFNR